MSVRYLVEAKAERADLPALVMGTVARTGGNDAFQCVLWGNKETDRPMSIRGSQGCQNTKWDCERSSRVA